MHHNPLRRYAELQDELLTRQAARSLRAFVEQAWPVLEPTTPFLPNWHIDLVCEHLEAITAGETTRLLINLPPRYMKSLLVSVFWPVWEWISSPSRRWICVSYSDALSLKLSLDRRTLVQSEWYQARWGHTVQLSSDQNVKGEFRNTRQGVMVATSVGGSATGKGGDRIIVDDLHNPHQADSDAQREAALRFFRETLSTRLDTPKTGAVVVVMQRLHEADLSARCLELGYRHLCLPVEADVATDIVFPVSGRVVTRAPGHLLWPAREGPTELAIQRRQLGSTAFDTQYQQRPAPAGWATVQTSMVQVLRRTAARQHWAGIVGYVIQRRPLQRLRRRSASRARGRGRLPGRPRERTMGLHGDASASRPPPRPVSGDADHPDRRGGEWARDYQCPHWPDRRHHPSQARWREVRACPGGVTDRGGGKRLVATPATARARPPRARVGERLPAPALRVSDGRARRRRGCLLATHRALRQAGVELAGLVADDCSTQGTCVMTHASSARQLTARTKTANVMDSDTMAVAVDRRDGPAVIEDRPYGRPRRSSPWPWPLTPSRRAASPATTASRSESHRRGGLDTVRQWAWEGPWAAATHGGRGRRGWRKRHRGVDPSGVIRVHTLTEETGDDATLALDRLTAVKGPLARVTADAASDTVAIDETARARGATVVVPPARTATVSGHGPRSPARDRTIPWVKTLGRCRWKQGSGSHRQGRVENTCFRDTSIIGEGLRARSPARQGSAVVLGCEILNRMTALGRPVSSRLGR